MDIKNNVIVVITMGVLMSCNSYKEVKNHHHNDSTHTHKPQDYFGEYMLEDENFGTKTNVTIKEDKRIMVTNSLPNHVTGEFPRKGNPNTISAQNKTYEFPVSPKWVGKPQWVREPGIALNGVKFEPGTAEVVVCETGENYRVEAFQNLIDLGLDFNNAHVQPTGAYHYHGVPTSVVKKQEEDKDLVHIGFAHDGYPIYYSKRGTYKSGYQKIDGNREGEDCTYSNPKRTIEIDVNDNHNGTYTSDFEYIDGSGDLDECNGIEINGQYMYFVTDEFPYVSRCLMGEVKQEKQKQSFGNRNQRDKQNREGERPSIPQIMEHMDANKDGKLSKTEVKGPLQQEFSVIDKNKDGYISKEELENMPKPNKRSQKR
ncbi:YHYH protein [Wenyingzhuangia sp. IMCC45467]